MHAWRERAYALRLTEAGRTRAHTLVGEHGRVSPDALGGRLRLSSCDCRYPQELTAWGCSPFLRTRALQPSADGQNAPSRIVPWHPRTHPFLAPTASAYSRWALFASTASLPSLVPSVSLSTSLLPPTACQTYGQAHPPHTCSQDATDSKGRRSLDGAGRRVRRGRVASGGCRLFTCCNTQLTIPPTRRRLPHSDVRHLRVTTHVVLPACAPSRDDACRRCRTFPGSTPAQDGLLPPLADKDR